MTPFGAFSLATLGAAKALYLDDGLGNFAKGKEGDFVVLDASRTAITDRRSDGADDIAAKLFALLIVGDDRIVANAYLMNRGTASRNGTKEASFEGKAGK